MYNLITEAGNTAYMTLHVGAGRQAIFSKDCIVFLNDIVIRGPK